MKYSQIKTIDIAAQNWIDKVNNNSYFSAQITLNFGMRNVITLFLPFQYGYGDHYRDEAFKVLQKELNFSVNPSHTQITRWARESKITLRCVKYDKCLKKEVIEFGEK